MAAKKGRWLKKATARMKKKGTLGSYGSKSVKQEKRDIKRGGKLGKKAQFALAMKRIAARRKKRGSKRSSRRR